MRLLTTFKDEKSVRDLSNYLLTKDIPNDVEDDENEWSLWIHDEDSLESAQSILNDFLNNPLDSKYTSSESQAQKIKDKISKENKEFNRKVKDGRTAFHKHGAFSIGPVVIFFLFLCGAIFFVQTSREGMMINELRISSVGSKGLSDIFTKLQVWRLVTPALMHDNFIHIFFNCYWLIYLGGMIEDRINSRFLLFAIIGIATISNLIQYSIGGPGFYGFSGVNYGLFGFIWVMSRQDPLSGFFLQQSTIYILMGFLLVGVLGLIPFVANGAHVGGLLAGTAIGFARARLFPS